MAWNGASSPINLSDYDSEVDLASPVPPARGTESPAPRAPFLRPTQPDLSSPSPFSDRRADIATPAAQTTPRAAAVPSFGSAFKPLFAGVVSSDDDTDPPPKLGQAPVQSARPPEAPTDSDSESDGLASPPKLPERPASVLGKRARDRPNPRPADATAAAASKLRRLKRNDGIDDADDVFDVDHISPDEWLLGESNALKAQAFTKDQVAEFYQNVRLNQDAEEEADTPFQMDCSLMRHQKRALAWMEKKELYTKPNSMQPAGGILADEMGLGKTLVCIALMLQNQRTAPNDGNKWRNLVVCPTSMVYSWRDELFKRISPGFRPRVALYIGPNRPRNAATLHQYDVVLTTYAVLRGDMLKRDIDGKELQSAGPLMKVKWWRVFLDEAHNIKNHRTNNRKAACQLTAKYRWCVTGTPMENTVDDFYSLFLFLKFHVSDIRQWHDKWTNVLEAKRGVRPALRKKKFIAFQQLLGTVLLRRTKKDTIQGKPILDLPPKTSEVLSMAFDEKDQQFYDRLEEEQKAIFQDMLNRGDIDQSYTSILVLLLRLRQACNHPHLLEKLDGFEKHELQRVEEAMTGGDGLLSKMFPDVRNRLIQKLDEDGIHSGVMDCPICADVVSGEGTVTPCGHVYCSDCLEKWMDTKMERPECRKELSEVRDVNAPLSRLRAEVRVMSLKRTNEWEDFLRREGNRELLMSTKLRLITQELTETRERDSSEKTLVFSQWTSMMNLIANVLEKNGFNYVRIDGSMTPDERASSILQFESRSDTTVFLISLKAGGVGLNLTSASRVLLVDPWWNPAVEDQAVDRCYRIGQTRPVTVKQLTIANTVESRVLGLQAKKRELFNNSLGAEGAEFKAKRRLSLDDLLELFGMAAEDYARDDDDDE